MFVRKNVDKIQDFWNNILWTDKSKTELFGHQNRGYVWCKANAAIQEKNLMPTMKQGFLLQQDLASSAP